MANNPGVPQNRIVAGTLDSASQPSVQFGGSFDIGSGLGIRGDGSQILLSVGGSDKLTLSATALTLASGVSLALPSQSANVVFAGPATGAAAAPAFRALVKADIDPIIRVFTSSAGAGGEASEAMVLTGLLATDTILSVVQKTPGANNLPIIGYSTLANNALTGIWASDPGAGAVIVVTVKR